MQRVAGLERLLQRINPVAEVVVLEHGRRRPVEGDSSGVDLPGTVARWMESIAAALVVREDDRCRGSPPPAARDRSRREGWSPSAGAARRPHTFRSAARTRRAAPSRSDAVTVRDCSTLVL